MSKLTKLIKHPIRFFQDSLPAAKPAAKPAALTLITDAMNPFKKCAHILHTGEGMTHGPSHLEQWLPFFIQSGEHFLVLVRNQDLYKWVREHYSYVSVVYAKNPTDVEKLLNNTPFVKAIYYTSNTGNLIHTLRSNIYQHIFLGHGDSDKSASAHKFFRVYDEIWVAGQAHIDRFKNASFETKHIDFVKVGRPALAHVLKANTKNWKERHTPRILYLPTWEGVYEESNYSSVRFSATMLQELAERFQFPLTIKLHPVTGSRDTVLKNISKDIKDTLKETGIEYYLIDKLTPVHSLLTTNNIYICDISAVVSECIAGNGPIFVYIPTDKEIIMSQSDMSYEDYAYTFSSIDELCEKLEKVLNGDDPKASKRDEAREYLLSVQQTIDQEFFHQLKRISTQDPLKINEREEIIQ